MTASLPTYSPEPISSRAARFIAWADRQHAWLAGGLILLFLVSGVATLHHYGLAWDEGLGNLFFGERYLHYFLTFQQKYLDFQADLAGLAGKPLHLFLSPYHNTPWEFPPLADTLSAAGMYFFSYSLKWLNPVDGFHLFTVLLASLFLWALYRFAEPRLGKVAAFSAVLLLAAFPRFWADMHFNVKDVPEAVFFGLVIMAFWGWYSRPRWPSAVGTGLLWGCALAVKANAAFLPAILLAAVLPLSTDRRTLGAFLTHFRRCWHHYLLMAAAGLGLYILSWPYLYANPVSGLKQYWGYILSQGGRSGSAFFNLDPIRQAVTTMPEIMLLLAAAGTVLVFRKAWTGKPTVWRLILLWALVPITRASAPYTVNFDGIRHFLEFVPAACLMAGYAAGQAVDWAGRRAGIPGRLAAAGALAVIAAANLIPVHLAYTPYQYLYYNILTGGLSGARDRFLGSQASDYWASSYRQGMQWLNQNAPPGSYLQALVAPWTVEISGPAFLRPEIQVVSAADMPDFAVMESSPTPYYLMFTLANAGDNQDEVDYIRSRASLVHRIRVDGVPILEIYKMGG